MAILICASVAQRSARSKRMPHDRSRLDCPYRRCYSHILLCRAEHALPQCRGLSSPLLGSSPVRSLVSQKTLVDRVDGVARDENSAGIFRRVDSGGSWVAPRDAFLARALTAVYGDLRVAQKYDITYGTFWSAGARCPPG
jgi:hypothetical protein